MKVLVAGATRNYGVAVIRALAESGLEVIGADNRRLPSSIRNGFIVEMNEHAMEQ